MDVNAVNEPVVDVYDPYLAHVKTNDLTNARCNLAGAAIGGYALFAGGAVYSGMASNAEPSNVVDAYKYV